MSHTSFTTTTRGLDRNSPPMRLYEKARGQTLDEFNRTTKQIIEAEDA